MYNTVSGLQASSFKLGKEEASPQQRDEIVAGTPEEPPQAAVFFFLDKFIDRSSELVQSSCAFCASDYTVKSCACL